MIISSDSDTLAWIWGFIWNVSVLLRQPPAVTPERIRLMKGLEVN